MKKNLLSLFFCALIGSSGFAQNLVSNGGFEMPNDGNKHLFITERTGWLSDDTLSNRNGTEHSTNMFGNYYWFNVNTAGTIYQPIDIITSDSANYIVSYTYGTVWNADAGKDTIYSVVYFSHYTPGSSIKDRILIDSIATDVTSAEWNSFITVSYTLPADTNYAGDSLIVEFATRVVDHHAVNNNTWAAADSMAVFKITGEMVWKDFNVAIKVDTINITSASDFSVKGKIGWDSSYIYVHFDVMDDSIYAPDNSYMNDNFEVYFDMTNAKTPAWPRGQSIWPASYNGELGTYQLRLIPGREFDTVNTTYQGWGIQDYVETATGYTFDLKVIIDSLYKGYVPEVRKIIGFDVLASDNDNEPYYRDQLSLFAPTANIWCDAALWGSIAFTYNGSFDVIYDVTKPTKATTLAVTPNNTQVLLTWDTASDNIVVDKYIVFVNNEEYKIVYAKKTGNACVISGITPDVEYTFSVVAMDVAGNQSDKANFKYTNHTPVNGLNNVEMSRLNIYPNPSSSSISLNNQDRVNLEVFNISGQLILFKTVNSNEKVDISSLVNGMYTLRVTENEKISVLKLIKN
jgi:hypothetical protein